MEAHTLLGRIGILDANLSEDAWESLLDELKAERVPSRRQTAKKVSVVVGPNGRIDAFIYLARP